MELDETKNGWNPGQWVIGVRSDLPLTADEQAAVDEFRRRFPKERRQLRSFWHERYGQYWIYEINWPEKQIGCVFPDQLARDAMRNGKVEA